MKQLKARIVSNGTPDGTTVYVGEEGTDSQTWRELAGVSAAMFEIETGTIGWVMLKLRYESADLTGDVGALFANDGSCTVMNEGFIEAQERKVSDE